MGTEHWICETGPCPCGEGTIEIEQVEPDHGWAQTINYFPRLRCAACSDMYGFADRKLVHKADSEGYHAALVAYHKAKTATDSLPILDYLRRALVPILESLPTKIARHRWLVARGIETRTYSTFIKHWKTADRWVASGVNRYNMLEVAAAVGVDPSPIHEHEALVARLREERYREIEAIPTSMRHLVVWVGLYTIQVAGWRGMPRYPRF